MPKYTTEHCALSAFTVLQNQITCAYRFHESNQSRSNYNGYHSTILLASA